MSLFGANTTFKKAVARMKAEESKKGSNTPTEASATSSSHIGDVLDKELDKIRGPLTIDYEGTATTSEIARECSQAQREEQFQGFHGTQEYEMLKAGEEKAKFEMGHHQARIEDDMRRCEDSQATPRQESGWLPSDLSDMTGFSDLTGKTGVTGITRYRSSSKCVDSEVSSELSSPPPTTDYGGSILAMPPSAISQVPFATPGTSGKSILAARYIQLEEDTGQNAASSEDEEGGVEETLRVDTPIPRKF
jgi:hypothetical protein